jgi:hypothetical protein
MPKTAADAWLTPRGAAPATAPSTAPNGGLQLIEGGKTAARFLPETAVEWFGVGFFSVFDAFVAYEDFDAIMASNQAQDEEIWAQNRSSQDRTNQQLLHRSPKPAPALSGRYNDPCAWPDTPEEMDQMLGVEGTRVPDGPNYPGRGKVIWKLGLVTITHESHPYDPPDAVIPGHSDPHWHMDTPGKRHQRFCRGDKIPGMP